MSNDGDTAPLEPVDWDRVDDARSVPWRLVGLLGCLGLLAAARLHYGEHGDIFLEFPSRLTWVYRASLVVLAFLVVPPLVRNPARTRRRWERFKSNRFAVVCLAFLAGYTLLVLVGPAFIDRPNLGVGNGFQPPAFLTAPLSGDCLGPVVSSGGGKLCRGTLTYPLGSAHLGYDMRPLLFWGMRTTFQVAAITTVIMVPLATAVGVVSGYVGGWVDTLLMGYVDVQQSVPAFVVYIILAFVFRTSLLLLVVVFGLLSWGSMARLVRSETLQRTEESYVEAARAAGVSHLTVLRRHVLPNVSNTVVVGATQKIPQIVLIEAALTYIALGDVGQWYPSFGQTIRTGLDPYYRATSPGVMDMWWVWLFPAVVLAATVIALNVVGDALRDALDPRGEA
ncbi:ABC transporter permease [Halostella litorea]|uniref:ABC transporter permease n=1 Tax=Halostella litorea TaxID=2528831 RepID=UPI001386A54B|nr:ABC transporter permease [Halostella litorea]